MKKHDILQKFLEESSENKIKKERKREQELQLLNEKNTEFRSIGDNLFKPIIIPTMNDVCEMFKSSPPENKKI